MALSLTLPRQILNSLMKDILLFVHVVVKTLNLEISRCHLAEYVKRIGAEVRAARVARLIFPIQPIRSLFSGVVFSFVMPSASWDSSPVPLICCIVVLFV